MELARVKDDLPKRSVRRYGGLQVECRANFRGTGCRIWLRGSWQEKRMTNGFAAIRDLKPNRRRLYRKS